MRQKANGDDKPAAGADCFSAWHFSATKTSATRGPAATGRGPPQGPRDAAGTPGRSGPTGKSETKTSMKKPAAGAELQLNQETSGDQKPPAGADRFTKLHF